MLLPDRPTPIGELMNRSGVQFGTSGARGLAADMTDAVCYAYTLGFLQYVRGFPHVGAPAEVAIAGDLRSSTPRIMRACARAVGDLGLRVVNCGNIPSPALAAYGIARGIPSLMITGSHIPDDRNGIKFNTPQGEILKEDEAAIRRQTVSLPAVSFDEGGRLRRASASGLGAEDGAAAAAYVRRFLDFFPSQGLRGRRIGLYEHSSVSRESMREILEGLGAEVVRLGRSDTFVPVDTEAIRPQDQSLALDWAGAGDFDCLVSTDGDGDRPLISDENGEWLRGDVVGILCARYLNADAVVTPVSSNTALERSGWFERVLRTRIGSPFVVAAMVQAAREGWRRVVGYEANGGFLTATDLERDGRMLTALPTRDAVIVAVSVLMLARDEGLRISELVATLPQRFTASDRLKDFPVELARRKMGALSSGEFAADKAAIERVLGGQLGEVGAIDTTDGLRITFASGEIAHLRPSGNAPELRAYTEADSARRAAEMNRLCMHVLAGWRAG
jgi:phosphomannomutase